MNNHNVGTEDPLVGWLAIASFLGVHETTAKTMEGLPVYRLEEGGWVRAYKSELNRFIQGAGKPSPKDA
jgi:hypothetical protein